MGCCCFNTLRGAAFFVSSIHIYNGLECLLKFIIFPLIFTSSHASKEPGEAPSFVSFMPGMVYSILHFLLGCVIFRGIESECARTIKWGAICFAITETCFFILHKVFKLTPTPRIPHFSDSDQPFESTIYKTLYYFLFTIVGGLIYVCILFLYLQQLSKGQDEFAHFFNITARAPAWLTPTTTTQAPQPPSDPTLGPPVTNNNSTLATNLNPGGVGVGAGAPQPQRSKSHRSKEHHSHHHHSNQPQGPKGPLEDSGLLSSHNNHTPHGRKQQQPRGPGGGGGGHLNSSNINPVDSVGPLSPGPPMVDLKEGSPNSPMFPYFLMRRGSNKNQPQNPNQQPQPVQPQRCLLDEGPPGGGVWHQRGPPPLPPIRGDFSSLDPGGTPRSGGSDSILGRNLLSPSRLVNHGHDGLGPPPPPSGGFAPIIPPFYPDSGEEQGPRRDSLGPGQGFQSPHYQASQQSCVSGYSSRGGGGPESLYQKIVPMSPGFDYGLR